MFSNIATIPLTYHTSQRMLEHRKQEEHLKGWAVKEDLYRHVGSIMFYLKE